MEEMAWTIVSITPPLVGPVPLNQALREAWHDYEAEGVVSVMAEWKASFWQEEYDVYTDTRIWRHKWVFDDILLSTRKSGIGIRKPSRARYEPPCSQQNLRKSVAIRLRFHSVRGEKSSRNLFAGAA